MSYTLRPYQIEAVNVILNNFYTGSKPFIVQAATGAGKSLIIAEVCHKLDAPTLILQPTKELVEQNYAKLQSYGITDISIYSASMNEKTIAKYCYATIGSIVNKPELFKHFKNIIIDECHLVNPKEKGSMYMRFFKAIGATNVCGLTATPYRLDKMFIKKAGELYYTAKLSMINRMHPAFWGKIAFKIETKELIDRGFLSPIKYFSDDVDLDTLEVNTTGADYTTKSLERFFTDGRLERLANIIQHVEKTHKRTLVFCSSIRQANRTKEMLSELVLASEVVTGETPPQEREQIVNDFKSGKIKILINVGVFTTGFDVPELDCVILARPTMSLALYYQMVGRGVRKDPNDPNKVLYVYDLAGVVERLGRVESIRIVKEEGYKDMVVSEVGKMSGVPLFTFKIKSKRFKFAEKTA